MVEAELARRERQRYRGTQTQIPDPEPEPDPVLDAQGTQTSPGDVPEEEPKGREIATQGEPMRDNDDNNNHDAPVYKHQNDDEDNDWMDCAESPEIQVDVNDKNKATDEDAKNDTNKSQAVTNKNNTSQRKVTKIISKKGVKHPGVSRRKNNFIVPNRSHRMPCSEESNQEFVYDEKSHKYIPVNSDDNKDTIIETKSNISSQVGSPVNEASKSSFKSPDMTNSHQSPSEDVYTPFESESEEQEQEGQMTPKKNWALDLKAAFAKLDVDSVEDGSGTNNKSLEHEEGPQSNSSAANSSTANSSYANSNSANPRAADTSAANNSSPVNSSTVNTHDDNSSAVNSSPARTSAVNASDSNSNAVNNNAANSSPVNSSPAHSKPAQTESGQQQQIDNNELSSVYSPTPEPSPSHESQKAQSDEGNKGNPYFTNDYESDSSDGGFSHYITF